jgi:hypothetical protein
VTVEPQIAESPAPGLPAPENLGRTEPVRALDYGAINAAYLALLGGLVAAARRRRMEQLDGVELLELGAATFALSKTIAHERIGSWMREPFVDEDRGRRPRGRRMRYAIGELVTCTRCAGAWSALALLGLRVGSPDAARAVTTVLAASALNDFMQASFRALCEGVNELASD